ncbi:MAG: pro-sigmaK processing inhibitor BofA family protein [Lagierella massiliensis]|nr:pro-sigmaK processing inhibitor BofA family protein [Lagierella massiliensis]
MDLGVIIVSVILFMVFFWILGFSIKVARKLILNSISGLLLLVVFNIIGGIFGITLKITFINALISGIFGIPGIVVLLLLKS